MEENKLLVRCECGSEYMEIDHWDDKTFCFTQFSYAPLKHSFRKRIKFLFTGEVSYNEIILDYESATEIMDFINENIKSNVEKETK